MKNTFTLSFLCAVLTVSCCSGMLRAQALDSILVDFGPLLSEVPRWNNVTDPAGGTSVSLSNARGLQTAYSLEVTDAFNTSNTNGADSAAGIPLPPSASQDSFYGNTREHNNKSEPTAAVTFRSLQPEQDYRFEVFASRVGAGGDNRTTRYILIGATRDTIELDAAENVEQTVTATLAPAADGSVILAMESGTGNSNYYNFYYLNAVIVSYAYEDIGTGTGQEAGRDTVRVDFGSPNNPSGFGWNNVTNFASATIGDLVNSAGFPSGYGLTIIDRFNNINTDGVTTASVGLNYPSSASEDSFYGSTSEFENATEPTAAVAVTGLDPAEPYAVELFASRSGTTENRQTMYILEGSTTDTLYLNPSSNFSRVARDTVAPASDGRLVVRAQPGPENVNSHGFYYLGTLQLTYAEAATQDVRELALLSPDGGEYYQVGKQVDIDWAATGVAEVVLQYSTTNGSTWIPIDTVDGSLSSYGWTVPDEPTALARVRISADTLADSSDGSFTIGTDTSTLRIVVLGSSTAAGNGASAADSSWVNRYRNYLLRDTRFEVVNLAKGGYTTYHILPTHTHVPDSIAIPIDQERNVTEALTYQPSAIIVNMPSNDAQRGFPARDQLTNFDRIIGAAAAEDVPVWIATTQPRNFSEAARVELQEEVRDSIQDRYGNRSIDFWSDLTDGSGHIDPAVDSGDGVHVNDGGHRYLFQRVIGADIDGVVAAARAAEIALPVTLVSFSAMRHSTGRAQLSWEAHDERDLDRYEVERATLPGSWERIGTVAPLRNGNSAIRYLFTDTACPTAGAHYRLRIVDIDGTFSHSPFAVVEAARAYRKVQVYPNPTTGRLVVRYPDNSVGQPVTLLDTSGRRLLTGISGANGEISLDLTGYPSGVYTIIAADRAVRVVKK